MMELRFTAKFEALMRREGLPEATHGHFLDGTYCGHRGYHIELGLLLIYDIDEEGLVLVATLAKNQREVLGLRVT